MINAYAAFKPGAELKSFEYEPGALGEEEVEINVEFCGVCRSDLTLLYLHWEISWLRKLHYRYQKHELFHPLQMIYGLLYLPLSNFHLSLAAVDYPSSVTLRFFLLLILSEQKV